MPIVMFSQPASNEAIEAIQNSNVTLLVDWVANGGDIDVLTNNDNTLLMLVSKIGDKEIMNYLLSQKVNLDVQNKAGSTALMIAAKYGHSHIVKILLDEGANPAIRNNQGASAALFALAYGHGKIYDRLHKAEVRGLS
jgi:ankyrin repeat protein